MISCAEAVVDISSVREYIKDLYTFIPPLVPRLLKSQQHHQLIVCQRVSGRAKKNVAFHLEQAKGWVPSTAEDAPSNT